VLALSLTLACIPISHCKALLSAGVPLETLKDWSVDPRVVIDEEGNMGSVFDALEDLDVADCLAKMVHLNELSDMI
jgi:hypothetical protein